MLCINDCPSKLESRHHSTSILRRRSELCAFKFDDLEVRNDVNPILHLRKSKADQESIGRVIPISRELANLIETWRKTIDAKGGFILRAVDKHANVSSKLSPGSISMILCSLNNSNIECAGGYPLTGHSFRVGAALDLLNQGETLERIMIKGGWKSQDSAVRYLQQLDY